ncbi:Ubiquitin-associated domain-containing protein isoform 2 [Schistosoma japonicum]|uniref:Domain-containing protein PHGDHL1 n=3 Tax=Schistosoma japonicum TaxID=6182 RepID=C1LFI3_SCHJA|nr:Ubiquitin-associated domain-containing protein isoform 2 [Schistosoma japonicum]CAX73461.1 domain-containing protein PHGDHL1 precursor [Schistosoma japonicum]
MLAPQSHSGFYKTTITKCFLAFSVIFSFILLMPFSKQRDLFTYNLDDIFENGSIRRVAFCQLAFLSTKDLVCGGLLLYYFRIFERRYGSRKFLSFLFYCATTTTLIELSVAFVLRKLNFSLHVLPSGPFNLIFPLFVPYFLDIPWVPVAHVMSIPITGKSFPYIFGFEIAMTSPESLFVCICGLITGYTYHKNFFNVQSRLLFPKRVIQLGTKVIGSALETPAPKYINKPLGATLEVQRQVELDRREISLIEATRRLRSQEFPFDVSPSISR